MDACRVPSFLYGSSDNEDPVCLTQGEAQLLVLCALLIVVFILLGSFCVFELWLKGCYRKDKKLLAPSDSLATVASVSSIV